MGSQGKDLAGFHLHGLGNGVSGFLVDGLVGQRLIDGSSADPSPFGERGQCSALGADLRLKVNLANGGSPTPDSAFLKVLIEAVDMVGAKITKPDVTDGLIDSTEVFRIGGKGLGLQVERHTRSCIFPRSP